MSHISFCLSGLLLKNIGYFFVSHLLSCFHQLVLLLFVRSVHVDVWSTVYLIYNTGRLFLSLVYRLHLQAT